MMDEETMNALATNSRQLTLIYNSQTSLGQQALGYVRAADKKIQTVDISQTNLGSTTWVGLAQALNMPLHQLFDPEQSGLAELKVSDFDTNDWLKLLKKNPGLLQKPIAVNGQKCLRIETPTDVLKFFGVDSAGLKKPGLGEKQETKPKSKSDNFI